MKYYAFDYGGVVSPLGDFGDYDCALEVAEDLDPEGVMFLMTAEEILEIANKIKEEK